MAPKRHHAQWRPFVTEVQLPVGMTQPQSGKVYARCSNEGCLCPPRVYCLEVFVDHQRECKGVDVGGKAQALAKGLSAKSQANRVRFPSSSKSSSLSTNQREKALGGGVCRAPRFQINSLFSPRDHERRRQEDGGRRGEKEREVTSLFPNHFQGVRKETQG